MGVKNSAPGDDFRARRAGIVARTGAKANGLSAGLVGWKNAPLVRGGCVVVWTLTVSCMKPPRLFPIARAAVLALLLGGAARGDEVLFRREVMAVLSKAGCNAGGCHGNGNGKGGFKLSLRGQDADLDWLALTREQGGRRVDLIAPENSLVLLKASAALAHEGGQRFAAGSPE